MIGLYVGRLISLNAVTVQEQVYGANFVAGQACWRGFYQGGQIGAMFSAVTVVIGIVLRKMLGVRKSVL